MKKYDIANENYKEILKDTEQIKGDNIYITAIKGIGKIFIKQGKIKEGLREYLKIYDVALKKQSNQEIFSISGYLCDAYEQMGDFGNALKYHKVYYNLRDSMFNNKTDKHIQQLQFDYELQKKQSQIELLTKNKIIEQNKDIQHKIISISLIVSIILLIIILVLVYRSRQFEKRERAQLMLQFEEIKNQTNKLIELNQFKDKIFSILSHDLRGPINNLTVSLQLLDEEVLTKEEFAIMKPEMTKKLASLNILLDNLLQWAQNSMKEGSLAQTEPNHVFEIANKNVNLLQDDAAAKGIIIFNQIPEGVTALCKAGQIDIVLRNLINNAIKFTNPGGSIKLSAKTVKDKVFISVTDTGIGMPHDKLGKLFSFSPGLSTYGTNGENGLGIGLLLCYEFIKASNGTISVTSEVNKGTVFTIELPCGV